MNEQSGIMSSDIVHLHHVRPVDQLLELSHRQTIQLPELLLRHLGGLRGLLVGREGVREGERREGGRKGGREGGKEVRERERKWERDGEYIKGYTKNEWMDCKRGKRNPYW